MIHINYCLNEHENSGQLGFEHTYNQHCGGLKAIITMSKNYMPRCIENPFRSPTRPTTNIYIYIYIKVSTLLVAHATITNQHVEYPMEPSAHQNLHLFQPFAWSNLEFAWEGDWKVVLGINALANQNMSWKHEWVNVITKTWHSSGQKCRHLCDNVTINSIHT